MSPIEKQDIESVEKQLESITEAIKATNPRARLLAVSKRQSLKKIQAAYNWGQRDFGENYLQEGLEKIKALSDLKDISWHFIGPIQSNKCKAIAENFDWVQSLDRIKIAEKLNQHCPTNKKLNVCVQINLDEENQKAGIKFTDIDNFFEKLKNYEQLHPKGLMLIPRVSKSTGEQAEGFAKIASKFTQMQLDFPDFDTLSMGMSQDYLLALKSGSNMVRLGTAIFGEREA
jgi:pyridoxal phosphate enzyme (YggS family)